MATYSLNVTPTEKVDSLPPPVVFNTEADAAADVKSRWPGCTVSAAQHPVANKYVVFITKADKTAAGTVIVEPPTPINESLWA